MKAKIVVVVCGNACHGKSTFAQMLHNLRPDSDICAFADPIKGAAAVMFGIPREWLHDRERKETEVLYGKTIRQHLQWLGTEVGRNQIHPDIWVHRMAEAVRRTPLNHVFIEDGRFLNELQVLRRELAGIATVYGVRIVRSGISVDPGHQSEKEIAELSTDEFDVVVSNDGTLSDLARKAGDVLRFIESTR